MAIALQLIFDFLFPTNLPGRWPHKCFTSWTPPMPDADAFVPGPSLEHDRQWQPAGDIQYIVEQETKQQLAFQADEVAQIERDDADLAYALRISQAKMLKDKVICVKFKQRARAAALEEALLTSKHLEPCRRRMSAAQMSLRPEWAGGAWFFEPMADEDVFKLLSDSPGLQLKPHHVFLRARDEKRLSAALAEIQSSWRIHFRPEAAWLEAQSGQAEPWSSRGDLSEEEHTQSEGSRSSGGTSAFDQQMTFHAAGSDLLGQQAIDGNESAKSLKPYRIVRTFYERSLPADLCSERAQSERAPRSCGSSIDSRECWD